MSRGVWKRSKNPPNFFPVESTPILVQHSFATKIKHACLFVRTAPLKCAFPAMSSRKNFLVCRGAGTSRAFLRAAAHAFLKGSSPAGYFATSPAHLASRPKDCRLGVNTLPRDSRPASAHEMLRRQHSWSTAPWRRLQSKSCNRVFLWSHDSAGHHVRSPRQCREVSDKSARTR